MFVLRLEDAERADSLRIVFANAGSEQMVGVARSATTGALLVDAFPNTAEAETYRRVVVEQRSHDLGVVSYGDERVADHRFSVSAHPLGPDEVVVVFDNLSAPPTRGTELAAIVESAEDAILSKDLEGTILTWNDAATRLYGYTSAEAIGQNVSMLLPDDRPHEIDEIIVRLRSGERLSQFETLRRCKDGSVVDVSLVVSPLRDARGVVVGAATIAREIGSRKQAEEQIRELAALVATSEDAIVSRTLDGVIRSWNPAAERLLGYTAEEAVGSRIAIVAPDEANVDLEALRASLYRGERHEPFDTRLVRKDGTDVRVSVASSAIRDESGEVLAVAGVIRDLTEHLRLEEQLRQAQKLEAIGSLAGGVAHDFNNVLTIIRNTSLLLGSGLEDETARARLQQIDEAVDHAASLTQQLLAFSRQQILLPEAVDLNAALQHTLGLVSRLIEARVHIEHHLGADLPPVEIDPAQLQQLILNLSINARDAMPEGGLLSFRTSNATIDEHYARGRTDVAAGSYVLLEVTDTGLGMDAATLERIFDPFYTTKQTGTGLGLSTVFGIVKQSRGHIAAYSEPGIGTTFKVYLRRSGAAVAVRKPEPSAVGPLEGDETILVVEDSAMLRPMLADVLESYGYSVLVAADGIEALQLAGRHAGTIDLVLTDVVMPRMNGRELVDELVTRRPGTKVLLTSGYPDPLTRRNLANGHHAFIQKPYVVEELLRTIRRLLAPT